MADSKIAGRPAVQRPRTLPLRLTRKKPPTALVFLLGVSMLAIAGGGLRARQYFTDDTATWALYLFCALFGLIGLLFLWSTLYQIARSRIPNIFIDLSEQPFRRGVPIKIIVSQPGPANWKAILATIECIEQHFTWKEHISTNNVDRSSAYRTIKEMPLYHCDLVDAAAVRVPAADTWRQEKDLTLPGNLPASLQTDERAILWRIAIRGTSHGLAGFKDEFEIKVQ